MYPMMRNVNDYPSYPVLGLPTPIRPSGRVRQAGHAPVTNAPVAARPYATLRPAGQASTPTTYSPWMAWFVGLAVGGVGGYFIAKKR